MKPDVWMTVGAFVKVRRKLPDWGRPHFIALAQQRFGTDDLTKEQLNQLISFLSSGSAVKPDRADQDMGGNVSQESTPEIKLAPNPGSLSDTTEHYMAGRYAGIRFGTVQDLSCWAIELLWESKDAWTKTLSLWRETQRLRRPGGFQPYPGAEIAPDLARVLERQQRQQAREMMPLPARPTIRQAFWGFNEGDRVRASLKALILSRKPQQDLVVSMRGKRVTPFTPVSRLFHPRRGLVLEVTHVRPNPETAPTVTLREVT